MGNYKKIDKDDILYIKNTIQDDERVLVGKNINEEYSHDELSGTSSYPDVVVKAKSAEEIAAIMKYAYENTIPVTPRGAGTGLVGSSVPMEHGIMIDTTLMNQILELDEENLTVTVEPGVLLMELSAYVEDHDFFSFQRFVSVRFRYRNGDVDGCDDFENQPFPVQCTCGC